MKIPAAIQNGPLVFMRHAEGGRVYTNFIFYIDATLFFSSATACKTYSQTATAGLGEKLANPKSELYRFHSRLRSPYTQESDSSPSTMQSSRSVPSRTNRSFS